MRAACQLLNESALLKSGGFPRSAGSVAYEVHHRPRTT